MKLVCRRLMQPRDQMMLHCVSCSSRVCDSLTSARRHSATRINTSSVSEDRVILRSYRVNRVRLRLSLSQCLRLSREAALPL